MKIDTTLGGLAERINKRQALINDAVSKSLSGVNVAVTLACTQGNDLNQCEAILGKDFTTWLTANIESLSVVQARKYQRASRGLLTDPNQRLLAFFNPDEAGEAKQHCPQLGPCQSLIRRIKQMSDTLNANAEYQWSEMQLDTLRRSMKPIVMLLWPKGINHE